MSNHPVTESSPCLLPRVNQTSSDLLFGHTPEIGVAIATTVQVPFGESANSVDCCGGIERLDQIRRRFLPKTVIHLRTREDFDDQLPVVVCSVLGGKVSREDKTTVFTCHEGDCGPPIIGNREIAVVLEQVVN